MTPEQLREIYRQRQMRPVRTVYHRAGMPTVPSKPTTGTSVRVVKPVANHSGGCCGKRRTTL